MRRLRLPLACLAGGLAAFAACYVWLGWTWSRAGSAREAALAPSTRPPLVALHVIGPIDVLLGAWVAARLLSAAAAKTNSPNPPGPR